MKHIIFTVTNDLSYDQRMDRICSSLAEKGYRCTLIGRKRPGSAPLGAKAYQQQRLSCFFDSGKLFYLEYNMRLLLRLFRQKADIYCAIDLDSFLPVYAVAKLSSRPLIYDAHEYFSELEEVVSRPPIHAFWKLVERFAMKNHTKAYTISEGYARLFRERYHSHFSVIRNVPRLQEVLEPIERKQVIIYQGVLNVGRGLEESILAMHHIQGLDLHIYGEGPLKNQLDALIRREELEGRITLCGSLLPNELRKKTRQAFAGLTLFSSTGLHHRHSLANRFFDYIHAGIPQVAMNYPEYLSFNQRHEVAVLIPDLTAERIAEAIKQLQTNDELYGRIAKNCGSAAKENDWEKESERLIQIYQQV